MATYKSSCHCGAIAFTLDGAIDTAIDCNCSLCRGGGLPAFFPRAALALRTLEASLAGLTVVSDDGASR